MTIKNVTVAGGGVLGSQIAYQTAFSGFAVTLYGRRDSSIQAAKDESNSCVRLICMIYRSATPNLTLV